MSNKSHPSKNNRAVLLENIKETLEKIKNTFTNNFKNSGHLNYQKFFLGRNLITHKNKRLIVVMTLAFAVVITGVVLAVLAFVGNNTTSPSNTQANNRSWHLQDRKYYFSQMKEYLNEIRTKFPNENNSEVVYSIEVLWNNTNYGCTNNKGQHLYDLKPGFLFVLKNGDTYKYYHGAGSWKDTNKGIISIDTVFLCKQINTFEQENLPWPYMASIYKNDLKLCSVEAINNFVKGANKITNKYVNADLTSGTITLNPGHAVDISVSLFNTSDKIRLFIYDKNGNPLKLRYAYNNSNPGDFQTYNDIVNKASEMTVATIPTSTFAEIGTAWLPTDIYASGFVGAITYNAKFRVSFSQLFQDFYITESNGNVKLSNSFNDEVYLIVHNIDDNTITANDRCGIRVKLNINDSNRPMCQIDAVKVYDANGREVQNHGNKLYKGEAISYSMLVRNPVSHTAFAVIENRDNSNKVATFNKEVNDTIGNLLNPVRSYMYPYTIKNDSGVDIKLTGWRLLPQHNQIVAHSDDVNGSVQIYKYTVVIGYEQIASDDILDVNYATNVKGADGKIKNAQLKIYPDRWGVGQLGRVANPAECMPVFEIIREERNKPKPIESTCRIILEYDNASQRCDGASGQVCRLLGKGKNAKVTVASNLATLQTVNTRYNLAEDITYNNGKTTQNSYLSNSEQNSVDFANYPNNYRADEIGREFGGQVNIPDTTPVPCMLKVQFSEVGQPPQPPVTQTPVVTPTPTVVQTPGQRPSTCQTVKLKNITKNKECWDVEMSKCEIAHGHRLKVENVSYTGPEPQGYEAVVTQISYNNESTELILTQGDEFTVDDNTRTLQVMGRIKVNNKDYNCKTYSTDIRPPLACSDIVYKIKNVTKNLTCNAKAGSIHNLSNCQIERGDVIEVRVPKVSWVRDYNITKPSLLVFYEGLKLFSGSEYADDFFYTMVNNATDNEYVFRIDGSNADTKYYKWGYYADDYGENLYLNAISFGFAVAIADNQGTYHYDNDSYNCNKNPKNRVTIDLTSPYTKPVCLDLVRKVQNDDIVYRSNDDSVIRHDNLATRMTSVHTWYRFNGTNQGNIMFKLKMRAKPGVRDYVAYLRPVRYKNSMLEVEDMPLRQVIPNFAQKHNQVTMFTTLAPYTNGQIRNYGWVKNFTLNPDFAGEQVVDLEFSVLEEHLIRNSVDTVFLNLYIWEYDRPSNAMNCSILLKTRRVPDDEIKPEKYMYTPVSSNAYMYDNRTNRYRASKIA
ncbi:MAG: hypothetical protein N3A71_03725 [Candidatus Dojkabacteria bacterium]|nr:hypothetical protein [Candidatus Dojkabacteria bacterium]